MERDDDEAAPAQLAAQPTVTAPVAGARDTGQPAGLLPALTQERTHDELRLLSFLRASS